MDTLRADLLSLLTSRLAQLIARGLAFLLAAVFGAQVAAGAGDGIAAMSAALAMLMLVLADLAIHDTRWGQAAYEAVRQATADPAAQSALASLNAAAAKFVDAAKGPAAKLLVLACILTPFAAAESGCGSTPADRYVALSGTLNLTTTTLADLRDAGVVTQAEVDAARPYLDAAFAAQAAAKANLDAGKTAEADAVLSEASAALAKLAPLLNRKAPDGNGSRNLATRPAGGPRAGVPPGGARPALTPP